MYSSVVSPSGSFKAPNGIKECEHTYVLGNNWASSGFHCPASRLIFVSYLFILRLDMLIAG